MMDADMQQDERILPEMLRLIRSQKLDVVVGSRRVAGGSIGEFANDRIRLSNTGFKISRVVCRCEVADPMHGFVSRQELFSGGCVELEYLFLPSTKQWGTLSRHVSSCSYWSVFWLIRPFGHTGNPVGELDRDFSTVPL